VQLYAGLKALDYGCVAEFLFPFRPTYFSPERRWLGEPFTPPEG